MVFNNTEDHHHFELNRALHSKMSKIYLFQAIFTFVKSSLGIFIPIYLYSIGFSIPQIILYSMGYSLGYLFFIPLSIKFINKFGFKNTIFISIPVYFFHILSISFVDTYPLIAIFSSFSFGLYMALFWPSMHSEIAINGSSKHRGSQIGTLQIISMMFGILAPIIGGFILEVYGYNSLLSFTLFFLLIGCIPLYLAKDIRLKNYNFSYLDYKRLYNLKNFNNSKKAFIGEGVESILNWNLWPIILFLILGGSFLELGFLYGMTSFVSILIIFYLKSYLDKHNKQRVLKLITKFISLNWYLRTILVLIFPFFIFIVETFGKLTNSLYLLSFSSIFYNNAKKGKYLDYIILREMYLHIIKMITGTLFIIILLIFGEGINVLVSLLFVGILSPIWLSKIRED